MPSNDPNYQRNYIKKHYLNNKDYYKTKAKERNERLRPYLKEFVNRYKLLVGCVDCGYKKNPYALQFDHIKGTKFKEISRLVAEVYSIKLIKEEIRKCEVRCANCHAIITQERRGVSTKITN